MSILLLLIPISLFLGGLGLLAFWWALKSDQFSDLEGNAQRILIDEDAPEPEEGEDEDAGDG